MNRRFPKEHWAGLVAVVLLLVGSYIGLFVAPAERHMGEVQRIMYVHVPTAWNALLCFTCAFVAAIGSLWTWRERWDATLVAASEAGIVLNGWEIKAIREGQVQLTDGYVVIKDGEL